MYYNAQPPTFTDFEREHYKSICDELSDNARAIQPSAVEGNIWMDGDPAEREALVMAVAGAVDMAAPGQPFLYLEVGFNAGHSAAMMLSVFPHLQTRSFDIFGHEYARPKFALLEERVGRGRASLTCGDSRVTLPSAGVGSATLEGLADVVRIDGGHTLEVAAADLLNGRRLAKPRALVLLDDCTFAEVHEAWRVALDLGVVAPLREGLGWKGMCVGRYIPEAPAPSS